MSESRWFAELCESLGLVPVTPTAATQLTNKHVLFTTIGTPRPVTWVRVGRRAVYVQYADTSSDEFALDTTISLVAVKPA